MVSLGMSLFFLCVQYPLMHKMYHRDTDDILNDKQLTRLISRTLRQSTEKLHIDIDVDKLKMQLRTISRMSSYPILLALLQFNNHQISVQY